MKTLLITLLSLLAMASLALAAGLGDTTAAVKAEYGGKIQADEMWAFGKPPRAGRLDANAKGLFGASPTVNPNIQQFFNGIRRLIPSDAKLVDSYKTDGPWLKETYTFRSASLTKVPDIREATAYQKKYFNYPLGTFHMFINYDIDDKSRVANFCIVLGLPEPIDLDGMKKTKKNPFN